MVSGASHVDEVGWTDRTQRAVARWPVEALVKWRDCLTSINAFGQGSHKIWARGKVEGDETAHEG
jgi:hypothetical protein